MSLFLVLAVALIAYGITYLMVESVLFEDARFWLDGQIQKIKNNFLREKLDYLSSCRYCCSVYVIALVGLIFTPISVLGLFVSYGVLCILLDHKPE